METPPQFVRPSFWDRCVGFLNSAALQGIFFLVWLKKKEARVLLWLLGSDKRTPSQARPGQEVYTVPVWRGWAPPGCRRKCRQRDLEELECRILERIEGVCP